MERELDCTQILRVINDCTFKKSCSIFNNFLKIKKPFFLSQLEKFLTFIFCVCTLFVVVASASSFLERRWRKDSRPDSEESSVLGCWGVLEWYTAL